MTLAFGSCCKTITGLAATRRHSGCSGACCFACNAMLGTWGGVLVIATYTRTRTHAVQWHVCLPSFQANVVTPSLASICLLNNRQPLVPVVDAADGRWLLTRPLGLMMKPGGHGAIWKLMHDEGAHPSMQHTTQLCGRAEPSHHALCQEMKWLPLD